MVGQIYPTELQLNKANSSDTDAPFLDVNLSITNDIVSSKIYHKRYYFNFELEQLSMVHHCKYPLFTYNLYLGSRSQNIKLSTFYIM